MFGMLLVHNRIDHTDWQYTIPRSRVILISHGKKVGPGVYFSFFFVSFSFLWVFVFIVKSACLVWMVCGGWPAVRVILMCMFAVQHRRAISCLHGQPIVYMKETDEALVFFIFLVAIWLPYYRLCRILKIHFRVTQSSGWRVGPSWVY